MSDNKMPSFQFDHTRSRSEHAKDISGYVDELVLEELQKHVPRVEEMVRKYIPQLCVDAVDDGQASVVLAPKYDNLRVASTNLILKKMVESSAFVRGIEMKSLESSAGSVNILCMHLKDL